MNERSILERVHALVEEERGLRAGNAAAAAGERLAKIAREKNILLMVCDQCAVQRNLAEGTFAMCGTGSVTAKGLVDGVGAGCFPQLYGALAGNPPDHVITL